MPEKPDAPLDGLDEDSDYHPDACSLRISAAVLHWRAKLAGLDAEAAQDLIGYAADFWALAASTDGRRPEFSFQMASDGAPADVFAAAGGLICAAAKGRLPLIGGETRTFSLAAAEASAIKVASASVVQHANGAWEVLHAEVLPDRRRRGLASLLYDCMDEVLGAKVGPSGWLSEDAYAFWRRRDVSAVAGYRRIEPFLTLWISPKQLLNLMIIDLAKIEALVVSAAADAPQRLH